MGTNKCEPNHLDVVKDPIFSTSNSKTKWIYKSCENSYGANIGFDGGWKDLQQLSFHEKEVV